jgi:hypothetical protein
MQNNMKKWADYLVSAVRFENGIITHFKVHIDKGNEIGSGSTWTRNEVLEGISREETFCSIVKDEKGNWQKGRSIYLIRVNGDYVFADDSDLIAEQIEGVLDL